jgi:nucleoside-diphosphate-sugar epimerase
MKMIKKSNQSKIITEDIEQLADSIRGLSPQWEGKTILLTGAGGFLGRYLVGLFKYLNENVLKQKLNAILLDNFVTGDEEWLESDQHLTFKKHNVIEPFQIDQPIDYIMHAAGIASPVYYTKFPIETMDVGTIGTRNMLELAREKKVKSFLFFSSSEVYGDPDPKHVPTSESYNGNVSISGPRSCYDESKRFGEVMCLAFWYSHKIPVKIIRPFNVYGPGIRAADYRILSNFIEHALEHKPLPVHGDGRNTRTFCYINDALEAILKVFFSNANGEAFNIGNPAPEISIKDLAGLVAKSMPHPVEVVHVEPPLDVYAESNPKRRCPNISKLQALTQFKPRYDLKTGLKRTIDWFSGS